MIVGKGEITFVDLFLALFVPAVSFLDRISLVYIRFLNALSKFVSTASVYI